MRCLYISLILVSAVAVREATFQPLFRQAGAFQTQTTKLQLQGSSLIGRWRVKFNISGVGEKNLMLDSQAKGSGSFLLLDRETEGNAVTNSLPAAWSQTSNDRVSFSGEVELPLGTCCREIGTLIFKGKFASNNSITGKAIFVTSTEDEENFNGFRSMLGSFTATREPVTDRGRE